MAGAKNHDYHILPPSPWPLASSMSALLMASGAIMWMHSVPGGGWAFLAGLAAVMFFVGWFWAFFDFALFPTAMSFVDGQVERATEGAAAIAATWPPKGLEVIDAFKLPLLNTLILLTSGTTVTWAHHALIHNQRGG